ncbi:MAG: hypothetical protein ACKORK_04340, partial [Gemmatimonadota bacterium]
MSLPRALRQHARRAFVILLAAAPLAATLTAQEMPFIGVRVDADRNKVLLEVPADRIGQSFMHQIVLATGGGVPALGLDRGQVGDGTIVRLERRGKRLLMVTDNWNVRAPGASEASQRAASEAFPVSVLASFPIEVE